MYGIIKTIITLLPLLVVSITYIYLLDRSIKFRFSVVFLVGWLSVVTSTFTLMSYSFNYAPSEAVQVEVANSDGAALVFSLFFGWVYSSVLYAFCTICLRVTRYLKTII